MRKIHITRISFITFTCLLLALAIVLQILRIQSSAAHQEIRSWAEKTYGSETYLAYPERGSIYDRWGNLLAGNMIVYEVGVDLQSVSNPRTIAETLASQLNLNYEEVLAKASIPYDAATARYAVITDFISGEKANNIRALREEFEKSNPQGSVESLPSLYGLILTPHLQRAYPEYTVASNVLGFYAFYEKENGHGYYGVEGQYDQILAGTPKMVTMSFNPNLMMKAPSIQPGSSLVLTIDREIQAMVQDVLNDAIKKNGSESGTIIVMDPETGEILAMASTPQMNLNQYWNFNEIYPQGHMFNRAISQTYEPGSIFKVLTMAAALDAKAVTPETTFLDTGYFYFGGVGIYNWDRSAWGLQDMTGCMQHSLNVCLSWIASELGTEKFYEYMKAFGIGRPTNIDLTGEQYWPLSTPGDPGWYEVNLATNSFGQGVAVTPIQLATAISAVANDGRMMAPHVVKAIVQDDHQYTITPQVIAAPISEETALTLSEMLAVSLEEESSEALVAGYRLSGKTGTAQIPINGQYDSNITNASFVGWGPTDDPKFLVYVWFEKPSISIWGSVVAAPVFSDVVEQLVVLMGIPPDALRAGMGITQ